MPIELIAAGFVAAYLGIAALGHVLVIAAICKYAREDHFGGRGRRTVAGERQRSIGWGGAAGAPSAPPQTLVRA
ncbi:MAG TPA: hypothetical protein VH397_21350 [Xanthobacteraceae bacterium]|jgi:hypothetical protein